MKRILVVKWDKNLGPQPVVQFPPEKSLIDNEKLLKIWSIHELQENPIVQLGIEDLSYLSYKEEIKSGIYFVILATDEPLEEGFGELHAGMANSLLKLIETPHFLAGLQEMYKNLTEYTSLAEEQLLASLYQDRVKSAIFDEIRQGVLNKKHLQDTLKKKYGILLVNLELLLSSFIRLGILLPENLIGEEYLFLKKDYYVTRLPPEYVKSGEVLGEDGPEFLTQVQEFFSTYQDISYRTVPPYLFAYFRDPAFALLHELSNQPLSLDEAMELLKGDEDLFLNLKENKLVTEINGRVFLLAGVFFVPFSPTYLLGELKTKYLEQQKPIEVLMRQMEILEESANEYY